jgi:hypothetical protein
MTPEERINDLELRIAILCGGRFRMVDRAHPDWVITDRRAWTVALKGIDVSALCQKHDDAARAAMRSDQP